MTDFEFSIGDTPEMTEQKAQKADAKRTPLVSAWSSSRLDMADKCLWSVYLAAVEKVPQENHPAAIRGNNIHDHIEKYIKGKAEELSDEVVHFREYIEYLREVYASNADSGALQLEENWAFDRNWKEVEWTSKTVWARMKLDVFQKIEDEAAVVDWKTGKADGKQISHTQQGIVYAVGVMERYPDIEYINCSFKYLDQGIELVNSYTRRQIQNVHKPRVEMRAIRLTTLREMTEFHPNPNRWNCVICPYGKQGCEYSAL